MEVESHSPVESGTAVWAGGGEGYAGPPVPPQSWGTDCRPHGSMSFSGLLIIACALAMLVYFVKGLMRRRHEWAPLWLGFVALSLGVIGTLIGLIDTLSKIASLGGAANPADLAEGVSRALLTTLMGLLVLTAGIVGSFVLRQRGGLRAEG